MKKIQNIISSIIAVLLLGIGLTDLAGNFDPVASDSATLKVNSDIGSLACTNPCGGPPRKD